MKECGWSGYVKLYSWRAAGTGHMGRFAEAVARRTEWPRQKVATSQHQVQAQMFEFDWSGSSCLEDECTSLNATSLLLIASALLSCAVSSSTTGDLFDQISSLAVTQSGPLQAEIAALVVRREWMRDAPHERPLAIAGRSPDMQAPTYLGSANPESAFTEMDGADRELIATLVQWPPRATLYLPNLPHGHYEPQVEGTKGREPQPTRTPHPVAQDIPSTGVLAMCTVTRIEREGTEVVSRRRSLYDNRGLPIEIEQENPRDGSTWKADFQFDRIGNLRSRTFRQPPSLQVRQRTAIGINAASLSRRPYMYKGARSGLGLVAAQAPFLIVGGSKGMGGGVAHSRPERSGEPRGAAGRTLFSACHDNDAMSDQSRVHPICTHSLWHSGSAILDRTETGLPLDLSFNSKLPAYLQAVSSRTEWVYNANNKLVLVSHFSSDGAERPNATLVYEYDGLSRVSRIVDDSNGDGAADIERVFERDELGRSVKETERHFGAPEDGSILNNAWANGVLESAKWTQLDGKTVLNRIEYRYDQQRRLIEERVFGVQQARSSRVHRTVYDRYGRVGRTEVHYAGLEIWTDYAYDVFGRSMTVETTSLHGTRSSVVWDYSCP